MRNYLKRIIVLIYRFYIYLLVSKKIGKVYIDLKKHGKISSIYDPVIEDHIRLWSKYPQHQNTKWIKVYQSVSGHISPNYIPENIYYSEVEPRLNFKPFSKALTDKNFYHKHFDEKILPIVLLRNIDGVFYTGDYHPIEKQQINFFEKNVIGKKLVIKPTEDSGGGSGVRLFEFGDTGFEVFPKIEGVDTVLSLLEVYKRNFLIQEYIQQHGFYSQFNQTSLNTIRVFTYRSVKDEQIKILQSVLRMGCNGSIVDNQAAGGLACGIDERGYLRNFGVDKNGNKYFQHNGLDFSQIGKVYKIEEIHKIAIDVAREFSYSRILGLDFCIAHESEVKLIEVNDINNEINFYQMTNGPLFGDYTKEVIEYCQTKPKSFLIDFTV